MFPFTVPGGKPVTALPGLTPRSPLRIVGPTLVTVAPASTAKLAAESRFTVGWPVESAPVVNVQGLGATPPASAFPAISFAPVVTVAVNVTLGARLVAGVNSATLLGASYVTAPLTGVSPGPVRVNVPFVMVAGSMASLNVALIVFVMETPVAALAGFVDRTVGGVVSAPSRGESPGIGRQSTSGQRVSCEVFSSCRDRGGEHAAGSEIS